jgi:predicted ATPase with chaperone activity
VTEPNDRDLEVSFELYDQVQDDGMHRRIQGIVSSYRVECERKARERVLDAINGSINDTVGNHRWLHVGELLAMLDNLSGEP